ncbi:hypothetical protein ACEOQ5_28095 [Pseudomonas aeruginosa]
MSKELNKAPVEQAGGDERVKCAVCVDSGKVYDISGEGPWKCYACTGSHEVVGYANGDELDNMLDDRTAVLSPVKTSFHTVPVYREARDALEQPSGEVFVTKNESGAIVSVTRQDKEGRVLSVIAESQPSPVPTEGFTHFPELLESVQQMDAMLKANSAQAEAERPEVVARVVHSNPVVLEQCAPLNANDEMMTFAQHAASVARWAEMFNRVEQERDAAQAEVERLTRDRDDCLKARLHYATQLGEALARVAELERQEPVALANRGLHAFWVKWTEAAAGLYGPGIKLYAAPVAQAQPEETPGEILAAKLIETWVTKHGKPAPWSTAVEITALATNMPNDERDRLLALDDDVDAQAQHSVPETINEEANSFLRIADAGQFKDNAVAVRTAAVIIRGLLHRPPLMQSIIRHRIGLTPEYEGQWHADLYGEDGEVQHHAEADTPDEAVRAVVALAAAPGKEGV